MDQIDERGKTLTLVHYVFQVNPERIACMPNMTEFHETPTHPNVQRTNVPGAVTCPACKESNAYKSGTGERTQEQLQKNPRENPAERIQEKTPEAVPAKPQPKVREQRNA